MRGGEWGGGYEGGTLSRRYEVSPEYIDSRVRVWYDAGVWTGYTSRTNLKMAKSVLRH